MSKRGADVLLWCLILLGVTSVEAAAQPPATVAQTLWPTPDWPVAASPEEVGFSAAGSAAYRAWLDAKVGSRPYGTVVIRRGKIAFERYGAGATAQSAWEIGSLRKSVASALLGIAVDEGKIKLDAPVYPVWPEIYALTGQEEDKGVTTRHLATATSGWKTAARPGQEWLYHNLAFTAWHAVIGRVYNLPEDKVAPLVERRLGNPLGAESWRVYHYAQDWDTPPGPKLAIDSNMRDLARYGYLWLRRGRWDAKQHVPAAYVAEASRNQVANHGKHYGYLWFTNDDQVLLPAAPADAYYHPGSGKNDRGTVLVVCPSLDLVAVIGYHEDAYNLAPSGSYDGDGPATRVDEWIGTVIAAIETENKSRRRAPTAPPRRGRERRRLRL